jgi:hypothetical protein
LKYSPKIGSQFTVTTLPVLDLEKASEFFAAEKASNLWRDGGFSAVFVEKGSSIICYSRDGIDVLKLEDLWNSG